MNNTFNRLLGRKKIFTFEWADGSDDSITEIIRIKHETNSIVFCWDTISVSRSPAGALTFRGPSFEVAPYYLDQRDIAAWLLAGAQHELARIEHAGREDAGRYDGAFSKEEAKELFRHLTGRSIVAEAKRTASVIWSTLVDQAAYELLKEQEEIVTLDDYNNILPYLQLLLRLKQEAGPAFPLVYEASLAGVIALNQNAMGALKNKMIDMRHSPAAWRTLLKFQKYFWGLMRVYRGNAQLYVALAFAMAGVVTKSRGIPGRLLLDLWYQDLAMRFSGRPIQVPPSWFRRAAMVEEQKAEKEAFIQQYQEALRWMRKANPLPDKQQAKAGWGWIMRQAAAWEYEQWKSTLSRTPEWRSAVAAYCDTASRLLIQPLLSKLDLVEEGDSMSHCVGRYGYDDLCRTGDARIFSIRRRFQRIATVQIRPWAGGSWVLAQVQGAHNSTVESQVHGAASRLAQIYSTYATAEEHYADDNVDADAPDDDPDDYLDDDYPDDDYPDDDYPDDDYPDDDLDDDWGRELDYE